MMKSKKWDVIDYLNSDEDVAGYLHAVLEDGDPTLISAAIDDVRRLTDFSLSDRTLSILEDAMDARDLAAAMVDDDGTRIAWMDVRSRLDEPSEHQ